MTFLKNMDLSALKFTPHTSVEQFEKIALTAKQFHQSLYCGGDLLNVLEHMYHFKNGRNYFGGKTVENITTLQGLIQNAIQQKFDPFNAVPAILLNLNLPQACNRVELIAKMGKGMKLNREIPCQKDIFFLSILDYLPLHNMFALMAEQNLMTLNEDIEDKLMSTNDILLLNKELPFFQLQTESNKLADRMLVKITAEEKLLNAVNAKLAEIDVGIVYGQYAGLNIPRLRKRMLNVA